MAALQDKLVQGEYDVVIIVEENILKMAYKGKVVKKDTQNLVVAKFTTHYIICVNCFTLLKLKVAGSL